MFIINVPEYAEYGVAGAHPAGAPLYFFVLSWTTLINSTYASAPANVRTPHNTPQPK